MFVTRLFIRVLAVAGQVRLYLHRLHLTVPGARVGFITGLVGAMLAAAFVWVGNWGIANWMQSSQINFLSLRVFRMWWQGGTWPLGLMPSLAILGALLGAVGSLVALRRYLKT